MDAEQLIGSVLQSVLTGRRKRGHGALRYLGGRSGGFPNASVLLGAAGVAWGLWEASQNTAGAATGTGPATSVPPPAPAASAPRGVMEQAPGLPVPPPIPGVSVTGGSGAAPGAGPSAAAGAPRSPADAAAPAMDTAPAGSASTGAPRPPLSPAVERIVQLAVSASRADGDLASDERDMIVERARALGAADIVEQELRTQRPLSSIVAGVTDPAERKNLYTLGYAIVRADEKVSGAERLYLALLAEQLSLDQTTVTRLEQEASAAIDRAASDAAQQG